MIYKNLLPFVETLENSFDLISIERQAVLIQLSNAIKESKAKFGFAKIIVVCTHNSRRSQIAQLWLKTAAFYYNKTQIFTYSGGTEATAFNARMVDSIKRAGFSVHQLDNSANPKYYIPLSNQDNSLDILYSKKISENYNPQQDYIAVMVCTDADENCPYLPLAEKRISIPYTDPKAFDNTDLESIKYDEKVQEIGREMLFVVKNS